MADIFPYPFRANDCATRLLARPGNLQRVMVVSEDVDTMGVMREILARGSCSTAVVFDSRQALEFLPLVNPDVMLVDLALPNGEALRVISRLKADPKTARLEIGLVCTK